MRMCYTLGKFFFTERALPCEERLRLCFPEDGVLILNGEHRYPCRDGVVLLPASDLSPGENLLFFRTAHRLYPCEGVRRTEGGLVPCGLPSEEWLTDLLLRTEALAGRVRRAEERLSSLEATDKPRLFDN